MENQDIYDIVPLEFENFKNKFKFDYPVEKNYLKRLKKDIEMLPKLAIGPYFWFISTNSFELIDHSDNLHLICPYKKDEWKKYWPNFLEKIMPMEDLMYYVGAANFSIDFLEKLPKKERKNYRFSIYARMYDVENRLRWVVFQLPNMLFNKEEKAVCGLVTITDLGLLEIINKPRLTILNVTQNKNPYYNVILEENKVEQQSFPKISNREREVLSCIMRGMKTPEIAEKLFISYHTVENHKKKLRYKTNTKTAAEMVNFILKNQLM